VGQGWFQPAVQAHYGAGDPELVEGGQLLAIHIPPGRPYHICPRLTGIGQGHFCLGGPGGVYTKIK
jgi:hypothetical protein